MNGSRGTSSHASTTRGTPRAPSPGQASSRGGPLAAGAKGTLASPAGDLGVPEAVHAV